MRVCPYWNLAAQKYFFYNYGRTEKPIKYNDINQCLSSFIVILCAENYKMKEDLPDPESISLQTYFSDTGMLVMCGFATTQFVYNSNMWTEVDILCNATELST